MSFNDRILSIILSNRKFGSDVESMLKRYRSLSIIYISLCTVGIVIGYGLSTQAQEVPSNSWMLTVIAVPLMILALLLLRQEDYNACSTIIVFAQHLINFYGAYFQGTSLASLFCIVTAPCYSFFLSPSFKIRVLNMSLTMAQFFHHTNHYEKIFKINLDAEQTRQITTLHSAAFSCLIFLCGITFVQKSVEINL